MGLRTPGYVSPSEAGEGRHHVTTLSELASNSAPSYHAENGVGLINGLGLGCALKGCLEKGAQHVTVVELSPRSSSLSNPTSRRTTREG